MSFQKVVKKDMYMRVCLLACTMAGVPACLNAFACVCLFQQECEKEPPHKMNSEERQDMLRLRAATKHAQEHPHKMNSEN